MNNFIKSILFLIVLLAYYMLIGSFTLTKIKIKKNRFALYVIVGWMITFILGWLTGFPAQLYSKSWYYFANRFQLILIIFGFIALIGNIGIHRKKLNEFKKNIKENPKIILKILINHIQKYWFIYLLVGIFTWFSITNLQPYTLNNYTDDHYITKMIHSLKTSTLENESQYTGEILKSYGKFSLALQQNQRMFNTYEIVYSYFANLFGISIVTFARFTMTIHNYLIWFLSFQLLASLFVDAEISQYCVAPFALLLIPEGFSARGTRIFVIRIFENWRNQTAIYMGGSIVRNCAFPLMLYFSGEFYKSKQVRNFLLLFILFLALFSFQTTAISYILLFVPIFIFGFILKNLFQMISNNKDSYNKMLIYGAMSAVFILITLLIITNVDNITKNINISANQNFLFHTQINAKSLSVLYKAYLPYYINVFKLDFFARFALFIIIVAFVLSRDSVKCVIVAMVALLFTIFKLNTMKLTLSLISFEYYCTARMLHSIELLIISLFGIAIIYSIQFVISKVDSKLKNSVIPLLSLSIILGNVLYINLNIKNIVKYHKEADGIIEKGYSTMPLRENDKMMPNIFIEVGKYFDNLPESKYSIFSFDRFKYRGLQYTKQYLLFASKKLEYYSPNLTVYNTAKKNRDKATMQAFKRKYEATWRLNDYLVNKGTVKNYESIEPTLKEGNLDFAFFTEMEYKNKLVKKGWKVVLGNKKKGYWVLKRS